MNPRIQTVYRILLRHGPQTSLGIAEMLNITRRMATDVLHELHRYGGSECVEIVKHPEFRGHWLKVWRAANVWNRNPVGHPPLHDHKILITDADEEWMKAQRERAATKAAFRNAAR